MLHRRVPVAGGSSSLEDCYTPPSASRVRASNFAFGTRELGRYCYILDEHSETWQDGVKAIHAGLWKRDRTQPMLITGIGTLIDIIELVGVSLSQQFDLSKVYQYLYIFEYTKNYAIGRRRTPVHGHKKS